MAGLGPAIHAAPLDKCLQKMRKLFCVDARVNPGRDDDGIDMSESEHCSMRADTRVRA